MSIFTMKSPVKAVFVIKGGYDSVKPLIEAIESAMESCGFELYGHQRCGHSFCGMNGFWEADSDCDEDSKKTGCASIVRFTAKTGA